MAYVTLRIVVSWQPHELQMLRRISSILSKSAGKGPSFEALILLQPHGNKAHLIP